MDRYIKIALAILAVLLVVLAIFFAIEYQALRHEELISAKEIHFSNFLTGHAPLGSADASVVRSWMTFDYINNLFALPPEYFKSKLHIADPGYPRLTVSQYAKHSHEDITTVMQGIEQAIRDFAPIRKPTSTSV